VSLFYGIFLENKLVMYVSVNKQLIRFPNCFGDAPQFSSGRVRRLFLEVFTGHITLCRGQHVARELLVKRGWCRVCSKAIALPKYATLISKLNRTLCRRAEFVSRQNHLCLSVQHLFGFCGQPNLLSH
jgi:hypothetical protein